MISLHMDCTCINEHWIPNLDRASQIDIGWRVNAEVIVSMGVLLKPREPGQGQTMSDQFGPVKNAMNGLRDRGIRCVPCCILLGKSSGHSFETWYNVNEWERIAEGVRALAACRPDNDLRVALDFEPKGEGIKPSPTERVEDPLDTALLRTAMTPLEQVIKEEEIVPMVLPGALENKPCMLIWSLIQRTVMLDEGTYPCPLKHDAGLWGYYETSKARIEALGRKHLPGFYAEAMRSQAFQKTLEDKGIHDYWCFFRRKTDPPHRTGGHDDPEHFWLPEWFRSGNDPLMP